MTIVLTLVAPENGSGIIDATRSLAAQGILPQGTSWLAKGRAIDIRLSKRPDLALLHKCFSKIEVDWALQREETRGKALFLSDMDSTMIQQECIDELASYAGVGAKIRAITERAMRGELDFESALKDRLQALKGLSEQTLRDCYSDRISFSPGAQGLINILKSLGIRTVLVSGGFTHFTNSVASQLGFDQDFANRLEIKEGVLTGGLEFPIFGAQSKLEILEMELKTRGLNHANAIAIGDGANDIPMLEAAGLGIAYKAKPVVKQKTAAWIEHTDLTTVLFFLGLPATSFLES